MIYSDDNSDDVWRTGGVKECDDGMLLYREAVYSDYVSTILHNECRIELYLD